MSVTYADRVQEVFTTTGTGTISLAGAVTGYQAFSSVMANAGTCYYSMTDGTNWEVGLGTYSTSGDTLARTTVLSSSNGGSAVNWAAGTKSVWLDYPANAMLVPDGITIQQSGNVISVPYAIIVMSVFSVGAIITAKYTSAVALAAGQTTAAANLVVVACSPTGTWVGTGDSLSGTWQPLVSVGQQNDIYLFQRTA